MRKVVVTEFLSLDGVMQEPAWTAPYWGDDIAQFKADEMQATDALLLGRVTYQGFAAAWPGRTDEGADRMNGMPKFVATTTLDRLEWNASRIEGDVAQAVAGLKAQPGQNLLVYGSAQLVQTLIQHDLVDEYRLLVYPVVLGTGKKLFQDGAQAKLRLVESRATQSGVVAMIYQPGQG
jgi:dihydrofolate reductase